MGNYDFSGYATRNDILCSDGRTIRKNAFKNQDGQQVPLVWNHSHNDPEAVLGHAILENRDDGVYAYCKFNDTEQGKNAKELVQHGDVRSLSIWANHLKQMGGDVVHGVIRELSLVLAGANPGAYVDFVMAHGDDDLDGVEINYDESALMLYHSDDKKDEEGEKEEMAKEPKQETIADVFNTLTDKQKEVVYAMIGQALEEAEAKHSDEDDDEEVIEHAAEADDDDETVEDVFNTLTDKQKNVVYAMIGQALEDADDDENEGGNENMKHNIFDQETQPNEVLSHGEMVEIVNEAKRTGARLSDTFLAHGIEQIDMLYPEATNLNKTPEFIKRDDTWVAMVMNAVHKTPFSRIKSVFADITEADARAKGYIKGNLKMEEFFTLMKRTTTPVTVYKKQAIDRDDAIDITEFDVIEWLKKEMRMMLDEELARAILVGDGRSASSNDKINEQNIRPIWTDDDVFTVKMPVTVKSTDTPEQKAKLFIKQCIKSRKQYKGSGNPVMYMPEDILTDCLLLEDNNGRVIYDTEAKLATALRVSKIVPVAVMEDLTRVNGANTHTLAGIYVNLADYNLGTDKGGAINMFDGFDIDYNKMKYLIETRCSGALTKPFSAVALEFVAPTAG